MPVRPSRHARDSVEPQRFIHDDGVGPDRYFGEPGYPTRDAAEAAWRRCRREVWAQTRRMSVPRGAREYDFVTFDAFQALWHQISYSAVAFDVARVLQAIADDGDNVALFRAEDPEGAGPITDFLDQLLADFEVARAAAHQRAAGDGAAAVAMLTHPSRFTYGGVDHGRHVGGRGDDDV